MSLIPDTAESRCALADLTNAEAAARFGCSVALVRLHRARWGIPSPARGRRREAGRFVAEGEVQETVGVRLPGSVVAQLRAAAEAEGATPSEVARGLILAGLAAREGAGGRPDPPDEAPGSAQPPAVF